MVVQSVQGRGGEHARLAHATPQELAHTAAARNEVRGPGQRRADRRSQALAKTDGNAVELPRPFGRGNSRGDNRIP